MFLESLPEEPISSRLLSPDQLELIAERFRTLGEPARLSILNTLQRREQNVSELITATGLGQANLSKHLQLLHRLGFVERRKEGVSTYYRIADPEVFRLCDLMCGRLEREVARRRKLFAS